jgi:hypothetical protein
MGLFGKKDKKAEIKKVSQATPELPELPKLPEFPPISNTPNKQLTREEESLPQLPVFPNNSLGNKFTQNTIKEAVAGEKEEKEVFVAEDLPEEHLGMMQKPLIKKSFSKDYEDYEQSISGSEPEKKFSKEYDDDEDMPETEEIYERIIPAIPSKIATPPKITPKSSPKVVNSSEEYTVKNYMTKKAEPVFIRIDKFEESIKIFQDIKSQISEIEKLIKNTKEIKAKEEEELSSWEKEIQTIKNQVEKVNQDIFSRVE